MRALPAVATSSQGSAPLFIWQRQHLSLVVLQILQWTFAAAPGHPVLREICDRIARTVYEGFSEDTNLDTLERTGPGLWTDIVLKHARLHPLSKVRHLAQHA